MRELTSFDHYAVAVELNRLLSGKRFSKMSLTEKGYKLRFRGLDVLYIPPDKLYSTQYSVPSKDPDNFSMVVRKYLGGRRVVEVKQINRDRVIEINFEGGWSLIFELFGKGNALLIENGTIVYVLREEEWRHRILRRGETYVPPPPPPIAENKFVDDENEERRLVRSGVPKVYVGIFMKILEEVGDPVEALNVMYKMLSEPSGYTCSGEPFPIDLGGCEKRYDTFNMALDIYTPVIFAKENNTLNKKLEHMKKSLQELEKEIYSLEAVINEIYENWSEFEEMWHSKKFRSVGKLEFESIKGKNVTFKLKK